MIFKTNFVVLSMFKQGYLLYGLIHARWIITVKGLTKMVLYSSLKSVLVLIYFSLSSLSLINSNESTLVVVHEYYTHLSLSFPSDSLIYLTRNQPNYFVKDSKTSTLLNLHDADLC